MNGNIFCKIKSIILMLVVVCGVVSLGGACVACVESGWALLEDLVNAVCPVLASATTPLVKDLFKMPSMEEDVPISSELVSECVRCGREMARAAAARGARLARGAGGGVDECSSRAMRHFYSPQLPPGAREAADASHEILAATKVLQMKLCSSSDVTPNTLMSFLEHYAVRAGGGGGGCRPPACRRTKYRSIDGSCNNEQHPAWGRRGAPFTRIATPRYADGIYAMPVSASGRELPPARAVSARLFPDRPHPSRARTYLNMQWGQLVTHDMLFHMMEVTDEGGIQCCAGDGREALAAERRHAACIPISVPADDPFYKRHDVRCLNFVRSVTAPREDRTLGYAEQMNVVTSFLDGSPIYGSDKKLALKLRSMSGGRLREESREECRKGFLPSVEDKAAVCDLRNMSEPCYLAGDSRINQTPTLALVHTLLLREHNRVADALAALNPRWGDERLYQEARRIVIAEIQHITYQEWLPLNFGEEYFRYYRISPSTLYSADYSAEVNPGVINSFGAAAFRFLHTTVPDSIMTCPASYQVAYLHKLSEHYMNPGLLESTATSFDDVARGVLAQGAAEAEPACTGEVTNLLFKSTTRWGLDLVAMDVQRGRDHGIAAYNDYREICGLKRARTFQDLAGEIPQDRIEALAALYECVEDVDLLVGGALERRVPGSLLGPTLQCIVAEQFYRTRVGDRYFYDNSEMPHSFTPDQLREIKKSSMARLVCDNTEGVLRAQPRAFAAESPGNARRECRDHAAVPRVDLTPWKTSSDLFDL